MPRHLVTLSGVLQFARLESPFAAISNGFRGSLCMLLFATFSHQPLLSLTSPLFLRPPSALELAGEELYLRHSTCARRFTDPEQRGILCLPVVLGTGPGHRHRSGTCSLSRLWMVSSWSPNQEVHLKSLYNGRFGTRRKIGYIGDLAIWGWGS